MSIDPRMMRRIAPPNFRDYPLGSGYPLTPQDTPPHQDRLWGRSYRGPFMEEELKRAGDNEILGISWDRDHWDIIERNRTTGHKYHNRIFEK